MKPLLGWVIVGLAVPLFSISAVSQTAVSIPGRHGVEFTPDSGGGHLEFEVPFAPSDLVFDPVRPYAYLSSYEAKLLAVVNLTNGLIERQFTFETHPESIAITPNGRRLYLALLRRRHSPYWFEEHIADIAEFDLERQVKVREFQIPADPGDLAVTDQGILIVAGGSDQWTDLHTYRVQTGELLGTGSVRQGVRLSLHPSQTAVYMADTDLSPSDIHRYDFDPLTGVLISVWDSPYHGDYEMRGGVWCHPAGEHVLVRGGGIFTSSPVRHADMRYVRSLAEGIVNEVSFDVPNEALFTVGNGQLNYYHLRTYELLLSLSLSQDAHFIHATPEALYLARIQGDRTHFERLHNYAIPHPFILQSPLGVEVLMGTPAHLSVTAIGARPLTYQWFHDGNPVSGDGAPLLSFESAQDVDSGDYHVVVSNSYGSITSSVARLTVQSPPIITEEPKNLTLSAGQSTTLFVRAGGYQPLQYQWSFEGQPLPGQTSDTLVLQNLQSSHAGAYRVSVYNVAGTALSSVAILRVTPASPMILTEPEDTLVPAGELVELRVVAAGTAPLTYQWRHAGLNIPGATQPTLRLFNVQAANSGAYHVMVTNTLGTAVSVEAMLTVLPAVPRFTLEPADVMAGFGEQIELRAAAVGTEPISFQWFRGNDVVIGATHSVLSLTNLILENAGAYHVVAANEHGATNSAVAQVTVVASPPKITKQPADATLLAGDRLALQVFATGSPPLTWAWFHQNNPMPEWTNSMLVVESVSVADAGEYYARISNSFGSVTSRVAVVSVRTPPALAHGLTNVAVDAGSDVLLAVDVSGDAPLTYTWKFNGHTLGTADSSSILLEDVTTTHAGSYHVRVENSYGSSESRMTLTVFGSAGLLRGWGDNLSGQSAAPTNVMDVVRMAGGDFHSLALRRDGTVVAWGDPTDGQTTIPVNATNVVAVAAGATHSLALRLDGQVVGWGRNDFLQSTVPPAATNVVAISAGEGHSVALRQDGSVVIWGDRSLGQGSLPPQLGFVVAVAAGRNHTVALRNDGRVFAWGMNASGQASVPLLPTGIQAIAAGYLHNLALSHHGTVIAWGDNSAGQTDVPAELSKVVAIAAGELHSLALTSDGRVIAWGDGTYGQLDASLPTWHVVSIAAGYYHNLATVLLPRLDVAFLSGTMVLSWEKPYMLQSSPELQGPYHDLSPSGSWTNQLLSLPQEFYRLKVSP